jgi:hypothetical protein
MFNKDTINVLQEVNKITNSVILKYPTTIAVSETQDIMVSFDTGSLDPEGFGEIPLKDSLSDFLSLFKLFEGERDVSIEGNLININSGAVSSSYIFDNIALMDAYNKSPEQFEKTEQVPTVASFELLVNDIKSIGSASGVFKDLSEVIFKAQDGDMTVSLGATNKFNAKSNRYSVTKACDSSKELEIKIPIENFKMLPVSDYNVEVKYNSARDAYRILMTSKSLKDFKIILSVKV